ncbi:iron-sulfur cluster repair di-iron protein [soil metagenome]
MQNPTANTVTTSVKMEDLQLAQRTVGEIVAEDFRRGAVLKTFGIDFCCGGGKSLADAAGKAGVEVEDVTNAIAISDSHGQDYGSQSRMAAWKPGFLADYIVNEHHSYVRESIPVLRAFTQKVARVHGGERPELVEIAELFEAVAAELETHMAAEEDIVFPRIKNLEPGSGDGGASVQGLRALIDEMEGDHDRAGEAMRQIRKLASDFVPPVGACNTYRASFAKLEEFEEDLHRHVHLENNVLFPKALALEDAAQSTPASPAVDACSDKAPAPSAE